MLWFWKELKSFELTILFWKSKNKDHNRILKCRWIKNYIAKSFGMRWYNNEISQVTKFFVSNSFHNHILSNKLLFCHSVLFCLSTHRFENSRNFICLYGEVMIYKFTTARNMLSESNWNVCVRFLSGLVVIFWCWILQNPWCCRSTRVLFHLVCIYMAKNLGVTFNYDLSWDDHVSTTWLHVRWLNFWILFADLHGFFKLAWTS
jgi:hypothetical protein